MKRQGAKLKQDDLDDLPISLVVYIVLGLLAIMAGAANLYRPNNATSLVPRPPSWSLLRSRLRQRSPRPRPERTASRRVRAFLPWCDANRR